MYRMHTQQPLCMGNNTKCTKFVESPALLYIAKAKREMLRPVSWQQLIANWNTAWWTFCLESKYTGNKRDTNSIPICVIYQVLTKSNHRKKNAENVLTLAAFLATFLARLVTTLLTTLKPEARKSNARKKCRECTYTRTIPRNIRRDIPRNIPRKTPDYSQHSSQHKK